MSPWPTTPTIQQSPPTPNLTPDQLPAAPAERRPKPGPVFLDRNISKITSDSRTASFQTARETLLCSDEDDDGKSAFPAVRPSAKTSQSTARQVSGDMRSKRPAVGTGFVTLDGACQGDWGSTSEVEPESDDSLRRNVTVQKRLARRPYGHAAEVVDDTIVPPTNATRALRSLSLQESPTMGPSRRAVSDQTHPPTTKSPASTVIEALLVETAPQRHKTLRHVRNHIPVRNLSRSYASPTKSAAASMTLNDFLRQRRLNAATSAGNHGASRGSGGRVNTVPGRRARREMWQSGAVPVVVTPDRQSSVRQEPSLRSTTSRRSKRTQSLGSAPPPSVLSHAERGRPSRPVRTVLPPVPTRSSSLSAPTSRNVSRSQSLTAGSLQAHNALQVQQTHQTLQKANQTLEELQGNGAQGKKPQDVAAAAKPGLAPQPQPPRIEVYGDHSKDSQPSHLDPEPADHRHPSVVSHGSGKDASPSEGHARKLSVDRDGDPFFGKRFSVQKTPFSQVSVDTAGTSHVSQAEVSQAMAVNIYPHQNKYLMVVDHLAHSSKPSASSSTWTEQQPQTAGTATSAFGTKRRPAAEPATPPQPVAFHMEDVDSPLRNPRAPPHPPALPAINFIPATPSGLTPTAEAERQLGHLAETVEEKPSRSMSLFRRALFNRHRSVSQYGPSSYGPSTSRKHGLITRTLSLSRNARSFSVDASSKGKGKEREDASNRPQTSDGALADESRLHPYWRPSYSGYDSEDEGEDDRGPDLVRAALPRRSFSTRLKRTFAILPIRDESGPGEYGHEDVEFHHPLGRVMPDRRTIRRTPSGNLRVVPHRHSMDSLARRSPPLAYEPASSSSAGVTRSRSYTARGSCADKDVNAGAHVSFGGRKHVRFGRSTSLPGLPPSHPGVADPRFSEVGSAHGGATGERRSSASSLLANLGQRLNISRQIGKRRREKRNQELRQMISGPREVRDGVDDVIRQYGEVRGLPTQQQQERRFTASSLL